MSRSSLTHSVLAQVPGHPLANLERADQLWQQIRSNPTSPPTVIRSDSTQLDSLDWDVVICGGTLGILIGAALVKQGWRVALVERGTLRGRDQEWNISKAELQIFLDLELLSESELDQAMVTSYNPARIGFQGGSEFWIRDVLNIGVDPVFLLATLKQRFLDWGGTLLEHVSFSSASVHPDGVAIQIKDHSQNHSQDHSQDQAQPQVNSQPHHLSHSQPAQSVLKTRLLLDAMGHFSPIVRQIRQGQKPDGICLVVGTCAQGIPNNTTGDLIYTFTPIQRQCQYFWEAFPARDGRTTYLFTYADPHPDRPSLATLFEDYLQLLPSYQEVDLDQIQIQRALFGFFPSYRQSPLQSPWDRILPVGDSSGSQSPLSFGGFGAMVRHLKRLDQGIQEALRSNVLDRKALATLQPYQPNVSVTWLFQKTMSVPVDQVLQDSHQINRLLDRVFTSMFKLGDPVVRPFLQDVVQFSGLSQTLIQVGISNPVMVAQILQQVGPGMMLDWIKHYSALGVYSALAGVAGLGKASDPTNSRDPSGSLDRLTSQLSPEAQFYWHRWQQAWAYGSGSDFSGDPH